MSVNTNHTVMLISAAELFTCLGLWDPLVVILATGPVFVQGTDKSPSRWLTSAKREPFSPKTTIQFQPNSDAFVQ